MTLRPKVGSPGSFGHVVVIATWRLGLGCIGQNSSAKLVGGASVLNREPDEGSSVVPDFSVVADVRDDR